MNLFEASNQWANRPVDERYWDLDTMLADCQQYSRQAVVAETPARSIHFTSGGSEVLIEGSEAQSRLTHHAFGQACALAKAPAAYLRTLSPETAASALNESYNHHREDTQRHLLFHRNEGLLLRSINSQNYVRLWNWEVIRRLQDLLDYGWQVPPARKPWNYDGPTRRATDADVLPGPSSSLSVRVGDEIAPSGLYASSHDAFVFLVNPERRVTDRLMRGVFIRTSEVGGFALHVTLFLLDHVCGNHICWNVSDVENTRIVHVGDVRDRWSRTARELAEYADSSSSREEESIEQAKQFRIGDDRQEVIDAVYKTKTITRRQAEAAYTAAENESEICGDPHTAWGFVQGLTITSQKTPYADERNELDKAGGKILEKIAF